MNHPISDGLYHRTTEPGGLQSLGLPCSIQAPSEGGFNLLTQPGRLQNIAVHSLCSQPPAQILGIAHGDGDLEVRVINLAVYLVKTQRRFDQVVQSGLVAAELEVDRRVRMQNAHGAGAYVEIEVEVLWPVWLLFH